MQITSIQYTNHSQTRIHVCTTDAGNFITDYPNQDADIMAWTNIEAFVDPIKNIKWTNKDHTNYRVIMSNGEEYEYPIDTTEPMILEWLSYNTVKQVKEDKTWQRWLRASRNEKLAATDWTQLEDADLTAEQKQTYKQYRKQLRNFPALHPEVDSQETLDALVWPTPPERE